MKKELITLEIQDLTERGQGVGRLGDKVVFVDGALPGDTVRAKVLAEKKTFTTSKVVKVLSPSEFRVEPPCEFAYSCGGCSIQHLLYDEQLAAKEKFVADALTRIGGQTDYKQYPIIGMTFPYYYRNKAVFPFGVIDDEVTLGMYKAGSHTLVPIDVCAIQNEDNKKILPIIKDWANAHGISVYDERTHKGLLRFLMIRSTAYGEHMLGLVINGKHLPHASTLIDAVRASGLSIKSIVLAINTKKGNAILGRDFKCIYGDDVVYDQIGETKYKLSLATFFQVNHEQTLKLYHLTTALCELTKDKVVWDIYCGAGSITLKLAPHAKWVYGNEIVPAAIANAKANAALNGVDNVTFIEGAAEDIVPTWLDAYERPDVVVLDPPRKGADKKVLDAIMTLKPERIVYVSCKPSTLARDVKILTEGGSYALIEATPVDMFPHSGNVETVVLLERQI